MEINGFKVIGAGGIGSALVPYLTRYLRYTHKSEDMFDYWIIDGDQFEDKNLVRQQVSESELEKNKAQITVDRCREEFPDMSVEAKDTYITDENIGKLLVNGDVILMGVDNHKTRKVVSDHVRTLKNAVLISGGNEYTDGGVQVYIRKNGQDVTAPLDAYHPEIAKPADKAPYEVGCMDAVESAPQLLFMNLDVASTMLNALHRYLENPEEMYGEVYVDILANMSSAVDRKPIPAS